MKFMLITNKSELVNYAKNCGIGRIFIDLEVNGKQDRQGHLSTLISQHSMSDITKIKKSAPEVELMVRLNPLHSESQYEINCAIERGADLLMLPMFHTAEELKIFSKAVNGRVGIIPLVETHSAILDMSNIVKVCGLTEIYIGLNDLHLDMGLKFMFEPLAMGVVDKAVEIIKSAGLSFGFGGVARVGEGFIPGELVLAEHVRLGSSSVILSRTFHKSGNDMENLIKNTDLKLEVGKLNMALERLRGRNVKQIEDDRINMKQSVNQIVKGMV
jgi:hypothetical protein